MTIKFPLAVVITGKDVGLKDALSKVNLRLRATGELATSIGKSLTLGVSAPLTLLGGVAVRTGTQVESNLLMIRAAANLTADETERLRLASRDYAQLGVGVRDATTGMLAFAKAGLNANEMLQVTRPTIMLSKAANQEFAEVSEGLVNVITGYRKEFGEATKVSDQLTLAIDATTNKLQDLFEAFKLGGPVAAGANQKFETTLAVLSLMGQAGLKATLGGTAVRGFVTDLQHFARGAGTFDQGEILARLGITPKDLRQANGQLIDMIDAVDLLNQKGATGADIMALFGERAGSGVSGLFGQGAEKARNFARELANVSGTAEAKYNIVMSGAAGATARLTASLQNLADNVARSGLLDMFTRVVRRLDDWTRALDNLSPATKEFLVNAGLVAVVFGPIVLGIGKAIGVYAHLRAAYLLLAAAQTTVGTTAAAATPEVLGLGAALTGTLATLGAAGLTFAMLKTFGPETSASAIVGKLEASDLNRGKQGLSVVDDLVANIGDDVHRRAFGQWRQSSESPWWSFLGTITQSDRDAVNRIAAGMRGSTAAAAPAGTITVDFKNTPPGTRVTAAGADVDLNVGYAMSGL